MGYRGDDLDLRTPQNWSASAGEIAGWAGEVGSRGRGVPYGGRGPIWVDDTVLAACNHAFEVALAHRAGEVRIEHLLYALTRVEAAAEILEKQGVRVSTLRRESATYIASDIPVGLPNGIGEPRRSEAFEDALRLAAAEAMRRNAPATTGDLLHVFLDVRPDLPGLGLLSRNIVRSQRDMPEPALPLGHASGYDPRYAVSPAEPPRERVRMPAGSFYVNEPQRVAIRSELAATTADTVQNTRIEALEQMVRALSHDLTSERKSFSGMLENMQRDFLAQRDDASRLGGGLYDRLQSLEQLVTAHGGDGGARMQLFDRLQAIEIGLDKRLGDLSRTWSTLSDRLQSLEQAMHASRASSHVDLAPLTDKMTAIERTLSSSTAATGDKLKSIEQSVASRVQPELDFSPISDRLDVIEEALLSQEGEASRDVANRLSGIERLVQSQRAEIIAETEVLKSDIAAISGLVMRQPGEAERMQKFAGLLDQGRGETVAAIAGPVLQRVGALQSESAASLAQMSDRLASAERALTASVQQSNELHKAYEQELGEVHKALVKLNTNQHTLAGTIDQWRTHGTSELSAIGGRIDMLARETQKPVQMLEQMSTSMDAMHKITVARYHRRNRFWYWLLGTDDWVAASWPSQLSKLESERNLVKPVRR